MLLDATFDVCDIFLECLSYKKEDMFLEYGCRDVDEVLLCLPYFIGNVIY